MKKTGVLDRNGKEIQEGDTIKYTGDCCPGKYKIKYGEGTYDSGIYTYIGFYCEAEDGDSDGLGFLLTVESELLEKI